MSDLSKPTRLLLNNGKRDIDQFADQFSSQFQVPLDGITRMTVESFLVENTPFYPNFPPYASTLDISVADVSGTITLSVPNEVDWTVYEVGGSSTFPVNFQNYLNTELASAGSAAVLTLADATSLGYRGFITWSVSGADLTLLGMSNIRNPERSITERLGLSIRYAGQIPELTIVNGRANFELTTGGGTVLSPGNYTLGRTSCVYLLSDMDNAAASDANIQNILAVVPVRAGVGLGDMIEGEDTNSLTTSTNPKKNFNTVDIILLDDNYQPFELREDAKVIIEFHVAYDKVDSVIVG